ncbi:lipocalin-like domain-containing protein [Paracraurococcus lichenis]|uniref:Lipocalin-like domain-containing protein n=1 Tax=Paracraurococcus lichenis TaxID=3064888 RepID=A0ABT9DSN6_9PROT|nr:lipocalin-like domain-containing protein [Paracraurococcus sp. LOR1-02]MDO9706914.1 lipocalin-like domain-containing protein [Paracraurococcus sp. LOR1-02]
MTALAGTMWKLLEVTAVDAAGQEVPSPIGSHPLGFVMFGEDRMLVAVADARPAAALQDAPARALVSYTGTYRFDGSELVTATDAASRPDLMMEQVREMRFEGATRLVVTPRNSLLGRTGGLVFVWERVG